MDFMAEAARLAREGVRAGRGGPFGAVVVVDGEIVGRGCNEVLATNDPTAHAEIQALRDASARLERYHLADAEIWTTCEPCPMCLAALHWAKIGAVHYAMTRHDAAALGFQDADLHAALQTPKFPMHHRPHPAAQAAFKSWTGNPY